MSATRSQVLSMYRQLLQAAKRMPSTNRRQFLFARIRSDFKQQRGEQDPEKVQFQLQFAEISLENINAQAQSLNQLFKRE